MKSSTMDSQLSSCHLSIDQIIPPSPNHGRGSADWLRNFAASSWFAYAAGSTVVITNSPSRSNYANSTGSQFFSQVLQVKLDASADNIQSDIPNKKLKVHTEFAGINANHNFKFSIDNDVQCVAWGGKLSPIPAILAASSGSFVHIFSPKSLFVSDESIAPEITFQWQKHHQLMHEHHIAAISWTTSGDGLLCAGEKVTMWQCHVSSHDSATPSEITFLPLWQTQTKFAQSLASASFSVYDFSVSADSHHPILKYSTEHSSDIINNHMNRNSESDCFNHNDFHHSSDRRFESREKDKDKGMATVWSWIDEEGVMSIDLPHPKKVVGLQWRPQVTPPSVSKSSSSTNKFHRRILLTSCEDGVVRLWMEIDGGKSRSNKSCINENSNGVSSIIPPSFFVCAVVEVERTFPHHSLSVNLWLHWAEEVWIGSASSLKRGSKSTSVGINHENDVAPCEWIIGLTSSGSVALWCLHCLDDVSPPRCPRVMMWQQSAHLLPPHSNYAPIASSPPFESNSESDSVAKVKKTFTSTYEHDSSERISSSFLIQCTVERLEGTKHGPPTSAEIVEKLPSGMFRFSRLWLPVSAIGEGKSGATAKSSSPKHSKNTGHRLSSNSNSNLDSNQTKKNTWGASTSMLSLERHDHVIHQISIHPSPSMNMTATMDASGNIILWQTRSSFFPQLSFPTESSATAAPFFLNPHLKFLMKISSSNSKHSCVSDTVSQDSNLHAFTITSNDKEDENINEESSFFTPSLSATSLIDPSLITPPPPPLPPSPPPSPLHFTDFMTTDDDNLPDLGLNSESNLIDLAENNEKTPLIHKFDQIAWAPFTLPGGVALLFRTSGYCIQVLCVKNANCMEENALKSSSSEKKDSSNLNASSKLLCELKWHSEKKKRMNFNGVYALSVSKKWGDKESQTEWRIRDDFDWSFDDKTVLNSKKDKGGSNGFNKEKVLVVGIANEGEAMVSWLLDIDSQSFDSFSLSDGEFRFNPSTVSEESTASNNLNSKGPDYSCNGFGNWFVNSMAKADSGERKDFLHSDDCDVRVDVLFLGMKEFQKGQKLTCASVIDSGRLPPVIMQEGFKRLISKSSEEDADCSFFNFVTGDKSGDVMMWNVNAFGNFQILGFIHAHDFPVSNLSVTLGGNRIATSCSFLETATSAEKFGDFDALEKSKTVSCVRIWEVDTAIMNHAYADIGYTVESEFIFKNRIVDFDWLELCNGNLLLAITTATHFHVFAQTSARRSIHPDCDHELQTKNESKNADAIKSTFNLSSHFEKYAFDSAAESNSKAEKTHDPESKKNASEERQFLIVGSNFGGWIEIATLDSANHALTSGKWTLNGIPIIASDCQLWILSRWIHRSFHDDQKNSNVRSIIQTNESMAISETSSISEGLDSREMTSIDDTLTLLDFSSELKEPHPDFHIKLILRYLLLGRIYEARACLRHLSRHLLFLESQKKILKNSPNSGQVLSCNNDKIPHIPVSVLFESSNSTLSEVNPASSQGLTFDPSITKSNALSSNPFSLVEHSKKESKYSFLKTDIWGEINEENKEKSKMFESKGEGDGENDNILTIREGGKELFTEEESLCMLDAILRSHCFDSLNKDKIKLLSAIDLVNELDKETREKKNLAFDSIAERFRLSARFEILSKQRLSKAAAASMTETKTGINIEKKGTINAKVTSSIEEIDVSSKEIAFMMHSHSSDSLLSYLLPNPPTWEALRSLGVVYWFQNKTHLRSLLEKIARNKFMEKKDAKDCALFYLSLDRKSVLQSLMKLSSKEGDKKMVEFFGRDFKQEKNRAAALKNAFVLLSQHRLELAASFFLLGGDVMAAAKVCFKNMEDPQLAFLLCHMAAPDLVQDFIRTVLLPSAIEKKDRWQISMLLWILGEKMDAILEMAGMRKNKKEEVNADATQISRDLEHAFDLDYICKDADVSDYCALLASHPSISKSENSFFASKIACQVASWTSYSLQRSGFNILAIEKLPQSISTVDSKSSSSHSSEFNFFPPKESNFLKDKSWIREHENNNGVNNKTNKNGDEGANDDGKERGNECLSQRSVLSFRVLNWMNYFLKRKLILQIFSSSFSSHFSFPSPYNLHFDMNGKMVRDNEEGIKTDDVNKDVIEKEISLDASAERGNKDDMCFESLLIKDSTFLESKWKVDSMDLLSSMTLFCSYQNRLSLLCKLSSFMNKKKAEVIKHPIPSSTYSHFVPFSKSLLTSIALESPSFLAKFFIFGGCFGKFCSQNSSSNSNSNSNSNSKSKSKSNSNSNSSSSSSRSGVVIWGRKQILELIRFGKEIQSLSSLMKDAESEANAVKWGEEECSTKNEHVDSFESNQRMFDAISFLCYFIALWCSNDNRRLFSFLKPVIDDQDLSASLKLLDAENFAFDLISRGEESKKDSTSLSSSTSSQSSIVNEKSMAKISNGKSVCLIPGKENEGGIIIESMMSIADTWHALRYAIWTEVSSWLKRQLSKSDSSSDVIRYSSFGWVSPQLFSKAQSSPNALSESIMHLHSPPLSPPNPKSMHHSISSPLSTFSSHSPSPSSLSPPLSHPHSPLLTPLSGRMNGQAVGGGLNVISNPSQKLLTEKKKRRNHAIDNLNALISFVSSNINKQFAFHEELNINKTYSSLPIPAFSDWLWEIKSNLSMDAKIEEQMSSKIKNMINKQSSIFIAYDYKSNPSDRTAISAVLTGQKHDPPATSSTPSSYPSLPPFDSKDESVLNLWKSFVKKEKIKSMMNVENVTWKKEDMVSVQKRNEVNHSIYTVKGNVFKNENLKPSKFEIKFGEPEVAIKMPDELLEAICVNRLDSRQVVVATNRKGLLTIDLETLDSLSSSFDNLWSLSNYPRNTFPNSKPFVPSSFSSSPFISSSPSLNPTLQSLHTTSMPSPSPPIPPSLSISPSFSSPSLPSATPSSGGKDVSSKPPFLSKRNFSRSRESIPTVPGYGGIGAWGLGWEDWDDYLAGYSDPPATLANTVSRAICSHPNRPLFLAGSNNTHVYLWEFGKPSAMATYGVLPSGTYAVPYTIPSVAAVEFDHFGQRFATSATDGSMSTWQLEVGGRTAVQPLHTKQCFARTSNGVVHFGHSGSVVVGAGNNSNNDNLVIWDTLSDSSTFINCHNGGARALCVMDGEHYGKNAQNNNHHLIVSGGKNGDVAIHDIRHMSNSNRFMHNTKRNSKIFVENSMGVFKENSFKNEAGLAVWYIPKAHGSSVTSLLSIPGTSMFVTGSKDGDMKVWDVATCQMLHHWNHVHEKKTFFNAHGFGAIVQAAVTDVVLLPFGILSSGADGFIKLIPLKID